MVLSAVDGLPVGQRAVIKSVWADALSTDELVREWGWMKVSAIESWVLGSDPTSELAEELAMLRDMARLMVRSPRMED